MSITYLEYKEKRQNSYKALPIFYAFSEKQMIEAFEERGLKWDKDADKIYRLGHGGYYLKSDAPVIRAWFEQEDELSELMKDYSFAFDAFKYEMANHEYHINLAPDFSVISCFGAVEYTDDEYCLDEWFDSLGWTETTRKAYLDARLSFLREADTNGWY